MDLREYFIKNGYMEVALKVLEKSGNPQEELEYLYQMPVCYESKKYELRVDHKYLLWSEKARLLTKARPVLIRTEKIKYCYFCRCQSGAFSEIGLLGDAEKTSGFILSSLLGEADGKLIFESIRRYVQGFETWESMNREYRWKESLDGHFVIVGPDGLFLERHKLFSGKVEMRKLVSSFEEICWCEQTMSFDGDTTDSYTLVLHLINGKKIDIIFPSSALQGYQMALSIKDNAPHLLYEPCEEYRILYKKDPAKLMEIAKSKMQEQPR